MKSASVDVARKRYWPNSEFVVRVLKNSFVDKWHGREREMEKAIDLEDERFRTAFKAGDANNSGVLMGEVSGIIHDAPPATQIVASNDRAGLPALGLALALHRSLGARVLF
jgi:nitronate monooxygenase